ncbi:NAD-dependent epimerase/dehydratase family protein [Mucilaginibacter sp. UR6-11]|uniref:NAD-dependent epimerase/dehydratase family protein n=1 Tax=Mucilaginibacter sp. UR6-11 TaxID=1435644 RepID=UPI001E31FD6A|nr:NAD-dependent epimerase/dehydratase family protein [Mucilaginibacter sp. UR6-11]MCC8424645.1 NAD-dependent epimerase/dehydratase family protein [Mucilaginibacter sp. UR6-11]
MKIKVIITGATGMVGEGVLLDCLDNPAVAEVLMVNRKPYQKQHPKLKELLVPNFFELDKVTGQLVGYDACFFCAGVSSIGMKEPAYTHVTYDLTLHFAETLARLNKDMVFTYVSGAYTDASEKGNIMWARVKGRTENALIALPFKKTYNFRPGFMKPVEGQKSLKTFYKFIAPLYPLLNIFIPKQLLTLHEVAQAMVNAVLKGYPKSVLEIEDIRALSKI